MENLPEELIEIILAHLPIQDLLKSCSLVSKQWNSIILRKNVRFLFKSNCKIYIIINLSLISHFLVYPMEKIVFFLLFQEEQKFENFS